MKGGDDGFTFIEVLVAMALLGMVTLLAYDVVKLGVVSWHAATHYREQEAERAAIVRVLSQAIHGAYPAFASAAYADRRIAFSGAENHLELITPLPEAIAAGVMARERYYIVSDGLDCGLYFAWALDLPSSDGNDLPMRRIVLGADIAKLQLAYYGALQPGQARKWSDQWEGALLLPEIIRVRLWRNDMPNRPWIDIISNTNVTTSTNCLYDLEQPVCRRQE